VPILSREVYAVDMPMLSKAREAVTGAAKSIADAMKVAILSCVLSVFAIIIGVVALTRSRNA
jgi:hypothetical protein